jgi:predicted TIM-barrel fold metal-dependent hydrolase
MGGCMMWDAVEEYLVGQNVNFDTCYCLPIIKDKKQFERIVKNHGSDKILFGSDCPWTDAKKDIEIIESLDLTQEEKQNIFENNAKSLLGIN